MLELFFVLWRYLGVSVNRELFGNTGGRNGNAQRSGSTGFTKRNGQIWHP
jgi:hypothetical protein